MSTGRKLQILVENLHSTETHRRSGLERLSKLLKRVLLQKWFRRKIEPTDHSSGVGPFLESEPVKLEDGAVHSAAGEGKGENHCFFSPRKGVYFPEGVA